MAKRRKTKKRKVTRKRVSRIRRHNSRRPRVAKRSRRRARKNPARKRSAKKSIWGIVRRNGMVIALGSKAKLKSHANWARKHFGAKLKVAKVKARGKH